MLNLGENLLFSIFHAWIWSLITGILAGYIAGKPREGAISSYIAMAISYVVAGIMAIEFLIFLILIGFLTWWPTTAIIGYLIGDIHDKMKLT